MTRSDRVVTPLRRALSRGGAGLALALVGPVAAERAASEPAPSVSVVTPHQDGPGQVPGRPSPTDPGDAEAAEPVDVDYGGAVTPGDRIKLGLQGVASTGARYEWSQFEGPPTELDRPNEPEITVEVPAGARRLGFLLTVTDARGRSRRYRIRVPIRQSEVTPGASRAVTPDAAGTGCRADAGDDQIGLVGRQITLDGSGSVPAEGLLHRWLQVGGPAAVEGRQDGPYYGFRPPEPGIYRFALVVAGAGSISVPDHVEVTVGTPPGVIPPTASAVIPGGADSTPLVLQLIALGVEVAPNGSAVAPSLAESFEAAGADAAVRATFAEIQAALSRRCDLVVPADPASRIEWNRLVFEPLTRYMVARLSPVGIDPQAPGATMAPLNPAPPGDLGCLSLDRPRSPRTGRPPR